MKLLFDLGVSRKAEQFFSAQGHDVKAVRDLDPRMLDQDVLELAVREARLVITMDKDFGELVYRSGQKHAGVLLLRLEAATGDEKIAALEILLGDYAGEITGRFAVFQNGKLRIR